jgi:hypothetical protein
MEAVETIHLTQVALGHLAAMGGHTVYIGHEAAEGKFSVGTLDKERCTQFGMDITVATDKILLSHTGKSDVFVTGYQTVAMAPLSDDDDEALYGDGGSESESESQSESEGVWVGGWWGGGQHGMPPARPGAAAAAAAAASVCH